MKRTRSADASETKDERRIKLGILDGLLGYHLRRAQVAVFQHFASTVGAGGVSPAQLGVLSVIQANPGLSQTQLGTALGIDRSTVVGMIDELEARGLVQRASAPNDRRSYALQLSEQGTTALRRLEAAVRAHENDAASGLGPAERRRLIALLRRIAPPG